MNPLPSPDIILSVAIILFLAIGLHEYAHCKFADLAGDPTPRIYGRVTLNLTRHFEPLGTMMMFITSLTGYGIGWGRPAPMDPNKMKNPRWDFFMAVLAGPLSNVVQAVVWAVVARLLILGGVLNLGPDGGTLTAFFVLAIQINLSLAAFNMIPLGPLDGHWIIGSFMPEKQRFYWYRWNAQVGRFALIAIILLGQIVGRENSQFDLLGRFLYPTVDAGTRYLLGLN